MAGETAWLDGVPRWKDGRVIWDVDGQIVRPGPPDLALAQRRLNQIGGYPEAARRTLGRVENWLAARRARLAEAKLLLDATAPASAHPEVAGRSPGAETVPRLVRLLVAEALCANPLPEPPSLALVRVGAAAEVPLLALCDEEAAPEVVKSLAALVLGALHAVNRGEQGSRTVPGSVRRSAPLTRAYRQGLARGLPPEPALISRLLTAERRRSTGSTCPASAARAPGSRGRRRAVQLPAGTRREPRRGCLGAGGVHRAPCSSHPRTPPRTRLEVRQAAPGHLRPIEWLGACD